MENIERIQRDEVHFVSWQSPIVSHRITESHKPPSTFMNIFVFVVFNYWSIFKRLCCMLLDLVLCIECLTACSSNFCSVNVCSVRLFAFLVSSFWKVLHTHDITIFSMFSRSVSTLIGRDDWIHAYNTRLREQIELIFYSQTYIEHKSTHTHK